MAKDRYTTVIKCPDCKNNATLYITENDGWSHSDRGAERKITRIEGSISEKNGKYICDECEHKWEDSQAYEN